VRGAEDLAGVEIGSAGKAGVGTGGMVTKVEAARIAAAAGIPVVLTSAVHAADALAGRDTGTYFHPTGKRSADRLLWLKHASSPQGALTLDDGAVRAVVEHRKSLLPAGIAAVEGDFNAGDPVELREIVGTPVVIDGRNALDPARWRAAGWRVIGLGAGAHPRVPMEVSAPMFAVA